MSTFAVSGWYYLMQHWRPVMPEKMLLVFAVFSLQNSKYQDTLLSLLNTTVMDSFIYLFLCLVRNFFSFKSCNL